LAMVEMLVVIVSVSCVVRRSCHFARPAIDQALIRRPLTGQDGFSHTCFVGAFGSSYLEMALIFS
jgi:hypothetical protein